MRTKARKQIDRARNRRGQRDGHRDRTEWRQAPATTEQIAAMRAIATETGHTFTVGITRGDAWRRIKQATAVLDEARRWRCSPPWYVPPGTPPRATRSTSRSTDR